MTLVFGRDCKIHPFENALNELDKRGSDNKAIAENIRIDQRDSIKREETFINFISNPSDITRESLLESLHDYHQKCIRLKEIPDFAKMHL